ncbi:VIT1/CCC1 transporter family protein [Chitinophagaceae bacterium LB-8]|uniref:VIT1/CCC1 transporter family protein n=1 Tax=Paraflavisolibacter caeni TaxID=2982496 RepID=A0A9X2XXB5_9BACT|nr:VIT1/CCC1 transporter family protein [Paraflavisolibacter caeni]MCU7550471.1 VIT1/CCC1 transporter family protein [Paraflavisolibacter caeni]
MEDITNSKRLLDPMDRAEGILFGLIMALSFTCSISIANTHRAEIRQLLVGAISCNLAWGLVDAVMYLIGVLAQKNRNKVIFDAIQNSSETDKVRKYISDALPPIVASVIGTEGLEQIRNKLMNLPEVNRSVRLTGHDIKKALAIFLLVFISTFPVVVPFVLIHDTMVALRFSNLVAIVMMFLCGWSVAKYVGFNKWKMSISMILIGIILVAITIALGG